MFFFDDQVEPGLILENGEVTLNSSKLCSVVDVPLFSFQFFSVIF